VWKWVLGLCVVLLLAAGGGGYYVYSTGMAKAWMEKFQPGAGGTEVRIGRVERGNLVRTISAPGQIEPKTKVEISSQVSARIIGLPFRENQIVKKGDVVIRLDAEDLAALLSASKASLKSEEARLEGARASHANAQSELARRRELARNRDISASELEQVETEFLRAESALRQAEFAIDIARAEIQRRQKDLDNSTITAPMDGIITKLDAEVGETVVVGTLNNPGSVIMEIADLSVMLLKARVDEANVTPVKDGQAARVFVNAFRDTSFAGRVENVGLKRQVGTDGTAFFETDILLEVPKGTLLRSGLTANADIEVETFREVLKVPSQAVLDRAIDELDSKLVDGNPLVDRAKKFTRVVFVMRDGKAKATPVQIGASDLTSTVILGGIKESDEIVVGPFKALIGLKDDETIKDLEKAEAERAAKKAGASATGEGENEKGEDEKKDVPPPPPKPGEADRQGGPPNKQAEGSTANSPK
jgi:HlyD family secretion protein